MQLLIIRHSLAEEPVGGSSDVLRKLTQAGRDRVARLGSVLKTWGYVPTAIFASPLTRTMETATLLTEALGLAVAPTPLEEIVRSDDLLESLRPFLRERVATAERIAIVGHQPTISAFVTSLLGCARLMVEYSPATTAILTVPQWERGKAVLNGMIPGDALERF
jgi:phosphohistidine phosphatase